MPLLEGHIPENVSSRHPDKHIFQNCSFVRVRVVDLLRNPLEISIIGPGHPATQNPRRRRRSPTKSSTY